ncbi:hypothetical protein MPTK1_7g13620 [Marchantia polymorpha subsp. ruderalis]|uniref:Uncharacterized protein n=2 Tax=Marchantia polymorpha TaxID=3197 RepID=A0AAF6BZ87_MARPO|nr:hypothetical protein MARPO_0009s0047 [Marchantia polymorpha]BBN17321.1 hypothetical protein Mp_7g13620 [Marchantia polymorpha subsp. ruderalis]|eukprot:PTQ46925.1 hypothetical protein MARPO_0009s0047 [Marchantia polymorpha]
MGFGCLDHHSRCTPLIQVDRSRSGSRRTEMALPPSLRNACLASASSNDQPTHSHAASPPSFALPSNLLQKMVDGVLFTPGRRPGTSSIKANRKL